jgi:conjugal transfer pilus assembly protein TraB
MKLNYKQYALQFGIGGMILFITVILIYFFMDTNFSSNNGQNNHGKIYTPGLKIDRSELRMDQMDADSVILKKEVEFLKDQLASSLSAKDSTISNLTLEIEELKSTILNKEQMDQQKILETPNATKNATNIPINEPENINDYKNSIGEHSLSHIESESKVGVIKIGSGTNNLQNYKDFIPAGSSFEAILLGSVDASCGVGGTNNPQPILLRILDFGDLPNNFNSDMKRCRVIGGATGDLSSERVYIRTEKLSCINKDGKVKEIRLPGYIVGEDGKNGIRGRVVDKASMHVMNAGIAGFFSGIGNFLKHNPNIFKDKKGEEDVDPKSLESSIYFKEMIKTGGSSSTSSAFDKLSDYYIKRAEQLQPVIQIDAGRKITVVVTEGFEFQWKNNDPNAKLTSAKYEDK